MDVSRQHRLGNTMIALALTATCLGCAGFREPAPMPPPPPTLGYAVDPHFQIQELNAEASDFVFYEHEFEETDSVRLNTAGEDHLRQVAARLLHGANFPVLVERSRCTVRESDEHDYPVHVNPELDLKRRQVIVQALSGLGISDAEERVVVSPPLTPGYESREAENAYLRGINSGIGRSGGFGGSGGSGGFGGFGRGGFFF